MLQPKPGSWVLYDQVRIFPQDILAAVWRTRNLTDHRFPLFVTVKSKKFEWELESWKTAKWVALIHCSSSLVHYMTFLWIGTCCLFSGNFWISESWNNENFTTTFKLGKQLFKTSRSIMKIEQEVGWDQRRERTIQSSRSYRMLRPDFNILVSSLVWAVGKTNVFIGRPKVNSLIIK